MYGYHVIFFFFFSQKFYSRGKYFEMKVAWCKVTGMKPFSWECLCYFCETCSNASSECEANDDAFYKKRLCNLIVSLYLETSQDRG